MSVNKIGVLAGAFDPIHLGHIEFIEETISKYDLDKVFLLIEKSPKHKEIFAGFSDRQNMVELSITDKPKITVYQNDFEDSPISGCLPEIKSKNPESNIYLLIGSDVAGHITSWPNADELLKGTELVYADRDKKSQFGLVTSGKIRNQIKQDKTPKGLDKSVYEYIKTNRLY